MAQYRLGEGPYGSAYRGTINDLLGSGDLTPINSGRRSFGLFLGHFDWVQTIQHSWQEPAKGFWNWFKDVRLSRNHLEEIPQAQDLRFTGDQHHLIVASSGAGKFRDVLSNMLLYDGSCETACLIIDPKGEVAATLGPMIDTADAKDPRTIILDPWDLCGTGHTDSLTLLDGIYEENPHCVRDARVLADAIIVERGTEDGHWVVTAKNFLSAILLYLGLDPIEKDERTLFRLRQIVTLPWSDLTSLLGYMSDSTMFEGLIARAARAMLNRDEKERRAILSTLERDTAFVEDPGLWKAIKTSTFDINKLVLTNKRLHVIVPFDYADQMSSWLRLTIAAFYNACLRNQSPQALPPYLRFRHIIIDEFAGLGKLDFIMKGIAEARGAGIKYHLVVQNFPQLHHLYKEGWESFVSNSFIHAFGVNDNFTAEYLSKMTGQATVVSKSTSFSESTTTGTSSTTGSSSNSGPGGGSSGSSSSQSHSSSTTRGSSVTFNSVGRPVLMPDEIRRISGSQQLLFLRGMPVLLARRTPYFQIFAQFAPRHTLSDVFSSARLLGGRRSLIAYNAANIEVTSPLLEINSKMRRPTFVPPIFRRLTFGEALRQSPGIGVGFILAVILMLLIIPQAVISELHEEADAAYQREASLKSAQLAAEAAKVDAVSESATEEEARAIDGRIRSPYAALATKIFDSITSAGLCSSEGVVNPGFSCSTQAHYSRGQLARFNVTFDVQRKQMVTLSVSPKNEKRHDAFSGISAALQVQSVFQNVDVNSPDASRFHPALRIVLDGMLRTFGVPMNILEICRNSPAGLQQTINGTTVSCRFTASPSPIFLADFKLNLRRPM
jgi:type IV secretory pathway TraG/TraD family ATPase VirD4